MKKVIVTRYLSDCGREYRQAQSAKKHDSVCRCWGNPKYRTCMTCKFGEVIRDSNGMEHEPQNLHTWKAWHCNNKAFNYDEHFTPAHEKVPDLCINCPVWDMSVDEI